MPVESVAFRYHVDGLGQLNVEGFEEVHTTLFVDGDPPSMDTRTTPF